jgi:hypothetical protein
MERSGESFTPYGMKPSGLSRFPEPNKRRKAPMKTKTKTKAKTIEEFDRRVDNGEDIFDLAENVVMVPGHEINNDVQRVNVDFPVTFLNGLDRASKQRGVSRQALIKMWLFEKLSVEEK